MIYRLRDVTTSQENEYKLRIQDLEDEILLLSETKCNDNYIYYYIYKQLIN